jgi:hypothetical protein
MCTDNNLVSRETSKEKLLEPQQINTRFEMLLISSGITKFILFHKSVHILPFSSSRFIGKRILSHGPYVAHNTGSCNDLRKGQTSVSPVCSHPHILLTE